MRKNKNMDNVPNTEQKVKKPNKLISFLKSRNAKRGSTAVALTAIFVALVVGLNIVVNLLCDRFPVLSADLTSNNAYELTETSAEHISKLDKEITIYVLSDEKSFESQGEYPIQANKLLHQFESHSKNIDLKYVNLTTNPAFTSSYPDLNWQNTSYLLLVEHEDEYIGVPFEDVFTYDEDALSYGEYVINSQNIEQAVLTAILNVTTEEKVGVTVLSGHGETECEPLISLLTDNAYSIETVSLLNGEISKDSQFVILHAPTKDIDKDDYDTLANWLYNDGKYGHTLFYVPNDTVSVETPYIDTLLEEWNMAVNKGWIFETDTQYMTNSLNPNLFSIFQYDEAEYSGSLKDPSIPVVMMYCMPVEFLDTTPVSLLSSSENAVIMPLDAQEDWDYQDEEPQKLTGAAISSQGNEDNTKSSNVIVFGSYDALNESALSANSFNNSAYIINLFNSIAQRDDTTITVESKTIDSEELGITSSSTTIILGVLFRYLVPLAIVVLGFVMWIRRRHK